jgi:hypothetical protein
MSSVASEVKETKKMEKKHSKKQNDNSSKLSKFITKYLGSSYNANSSKKKIISHITKNISMYSEEDNPLKEIIPDAILILSDIPNFLCDDVIYDSILKKKSMINELYAIVKTWPDIKNIKFEKKHDESVESENDVSDESENESDESDESENDMSESESESE